MDSVLNTPSALKPDMQIQTNRLKDNASNVLNSSANSHSLFRSGIPSQSHEPTGNSYLTPLQLNHETSHSLPSNRPSPSINALSLKPTLTPRTQAQQQQQQQADAAGIYYTSSLFKYPVLFLSFLHSLVQLLSCLSFSLMSTHFDQ